MVAELAAGPAEVVDVGAFGAGGRTVPAPIQIAAGLVTALIGAPYFVWLLWRSRPPA